MTTPDTTTTVTTDDRKAKAAELRSQIEAMRPVARTCYCCGRSTTDVTDETVTVEHPLTKQTVTYGVCDACSGGPDPKPAAARLLGVEPDEPLLRMIPLVMFGESLHGHPGNPNSEAWGHFDVRELGQAMADKRAEMNARTGGPCIYCGMSVLPEGQSFRKTKDGEVCERCQEWFGFGDGPTPNADVCRTVAASGLAGLSSPNRIVMHAGLGAASGLKFWSELGVTEGNGEHPWAHVNLRELRHRVSAHIRDRHYDPDTVKVRRW